VSDVATLPRLSLSVPAALATPWSAISTRLRLPSAPDASAIPEDMRTLAVSITVGGDVARPVADRAGATTVSINVAGEITPAWLGETVRRLNRRASSASDAAVVRAVSTLLDIARLDSSPPFVSPLDGRGIQLEWSQGGLDVEIYVSGSGETHGFVHDLEEHTEIEGELSDVVEFLMPRIDRLDQGRLSA